MKNDILSVGIDIGTTTSQVIFSRLSIENKAAVSRVPQISITDKEIIYRSEVYLTPLLNFTKIDSKGLATIIDNEYVKAGINKKDITVGAVIITGESSRKENSEETVNALGDLAGDFVVASAGPDLEGIIAGRGSGAADLSAEKRCLVANIDIGGGTSNIAIFDDGTPIDTACLDIGGRQICFEPNSLKIAYIAEKTKLLSEELGLNLRIGEVASVRGIDTLCERYAEVLLETLKLKQASSAVKLLLTDHQLEYNHPISYIVLSGGVADSAYGNTLHENLFLYNDIGIVLGKAIKKIFPQIVVKGKETIRATVIGAGAFTASLSGSTIYVPEKSLPLKNLPVIKLSETEEQFTGNALVETIRKKIDWNQDKSKKGIVFGFRLEHKIGYEELKIFSKNLVEATKLLQQNKMAIAIVIENDLAKAIGQLIRLESDYPFIVLDSIKVHDGDFLDIGKPLYEDKVVPVVVKSLVFN